jgi:hypothetical protein
MPTWTEIGAVALFTSPLSLFTISYFTVRFRQDRKASNESTGAKAENAIVVGVAITALYILGWIGYFAYFYISELNHR